MSNIGKQKIKIPTGVTINMQPNIISIEGKLGKIHQPISGEVSFSIENNILSSNSLNKVLWGTETALISNAVKGVSQGFQKKLNLVGIGYRVQVQGKTLTMKLGLSHDVTYVVPDNLEVICPKPDQIVLLGIEKDFLNKIAADICSLRKPDSYKGKGILVEGKILNLKEGKKK